QLTLKPCLECRFILFDSDRAPCKQLLLAPRKSVIEIGKPFALMRGGDHTAPPQLSIDHRRDRAIYHGGVPELAEVAKLAETHKGRRIHSGHQRKIEDQKGDLIARARLEVFLDALEHAFGGAEEYIARQPIKL